MTDDMEELKEITRKTAAMLFANPRGTGSGAGSGSETGAYALWREFDKDLAKHISMFFTGRLYAREVISQKQRELCAVAALTVLDKPAELRAHIVASMNTGATREEIAEVIFQMTTYAGVPSMVEGLDIPPVLCHLFPHFFVQLL